MKIYRLHYQQELSISLDEAWQFLSSPYHLNEITPDFFHVEILSPVPDDIYGGLLIEYCMRAVFGIPMTWLSQVSHCDKPHRFLYQQLVGPFRFLSHEVCLTETPKGVTVEDIICYAMPFGALGSLLDKLLIGKKLKQIFDCRRTYLAAHWPVKPS